MAGTVGGMNEKVYFVYLLASGRNGTLYAGSTSHLVHRVFQHKSGTFDGFTRMHRVDRLVWFEVHGSAREMVVRERRIKEWQRAWKIELIEAMNPRWHDLYGELLGGVSLRPE